MKLTILALSLAVVIYCKEDREFGEFEAADKEYLVKLDLQLDQEILSLNKLDDLLSLKWTTEEKKIRTDDLNRVKIGHLPESNGGLSSKLLYRSTLEEWLMANGSTAGTVERCLREMIEDLESYTTEDIKYLNWLIEFHLVQEKNIEEKFVESLKDMSSDDLPFRKFYSIRDFVKMTSSKRSIHGLSKREIRVYEEMAQYLTSDEDMDRKIFIIQSECDWKRAAALREAPNHEAMLEEFVFQVRDLVNFLLGSSFVPSDSSGPLNLKLIIEKREEWLSSREAIEKRLTEEVEKLQTESRDAEWLCEYARDLAGDLVQVQTSILTVKRNTEFSSKIWDIARRIKSFELFLEELSDIRYPSMNELATRIERDARCFEGFTQMVKNHHRKAIVSSFLNSNYLIQDLSCGHRWTFRDIIDIRICHCVGSFCVSRNGLPGLASTDYEMIRGNDSVYKIIPSRKLIETVEVEGGSTIRNSSEVME